ncbi:hypothetical protein LTR62_002998 [Meristemomyces frigidus]|uniref:Major facilitator superfamily (MFS) profile domain-containing protein n=1 Tax=Meristemomyces frigidus TaxID=1508187 RepID=A0AAN7TRV4_9PEZI|nr:hypothetical protein LTR62_002998 [Meristemomyces frigidus]
MALSETFQAGAAQGHTMIDEKVLVDHGIASIKPSEEDYTTGTFTYLPDTPQAERRLTTKIDFMVMPVLGLLYLICFLDRTNIANARLAGLEKDLHMPKTGFNTALWIFYIPFVLFEVPSNMIMTNPWVRPNLFLGTQTFILGVLAMSLGLVKSYQALWGIRFLLGIFETSLPAGATLLIASYYRKKELPYRFAIFLGFGLFGSCFSGLLAYAIIELDGHAGLAGWSWIFVIEGLVTIFFSIFVYLFVPHFPAKNTRLSENERERLIARLEAEKGKSKALSNVSWVTVFFDYRIWLMTLLFFLADISAGSLSSFNPTITSQLGWTKRRAQVMTMPIWIVGICGGLLATFLAGRFNRRYPFVLMAIAVSTTGWALHYAQVQPAGVRYFAQFLISFGTFICMPMYIGILTANLRGPKALSFGTAVQFGIGNCANFVSSNIFITTQAPKYPVGFGTALGLTAFAFVVMLFAVFVSLQHNKKIDRKLAALKPGEVLDDQVDYKYVI